MGSVLSRVLMVSASEVESVLMVAAQLRASTVTARAVRFAKTGHVLTLVLGSHAERVPIVHSGDVSPRPATVSVALRERSAPVDDAYLILARVQDAHLSKAV